MPNRRPHRVARHHVQTAQTGTTPRLASDTVKRVGRASSGNAPPPRSTGRDSHARHATTDAAASRRHSPREGGEGGGEHNVIHWREYHAASLRTAFGRAEQAHAPAGGRHRATRKQRLAGRGRRRDHSEQGITGAGRRRGSGARRRRMRTLEDEEGTNKLACLARGARTRQRTQLTREGTKRADAIYHTSHRLPAARAKRRASESS